MHVYIAPLKDKSAFKIGMSREPLRRLTELSYLYDIDAQKVVVLKCESASAAFRVESELQCLFVDEAEPVEGVGGTEFYSHKVYDAAVEICCVLCRAKGYSFVKFVPDKSVVPPSGADITQRRAAMAVKERRIGLGLTQQDLAQRASVSRRTVERFGQAEFGNFAKIVTALGIGSDVTRLVYSSGKKRVKTRKLFVGDNDHDPEQSGVIEVPA
jgi:DNA-binding XRE family transcriptional regulator